MKYFSDFETKKSFVKSVFDSVADKYDIMNDAMSFGIHRYWKDQFVNLMDNPNANLIDVAGGSGDISERFYKFAKKNNIKSPNIILSDINHSMINKAYYKHTDNGIIGINYVCADAENMPFNDENFDYYSVAFGIRNFSNIEKSLKEAYRILKKGGKFLCLEFSKPENEIFANLYNLYSDLFIPNLGSLIAGDKESYKYLVDSIKAFHSQEAFCEIIKNSGFKSVSYRNLTNGIVAIHTAYKI